MVNGKMFGQWKNEGKKVRGKESNKGRKLSEHLNKKVVILPSVGKINDKGKVKNKILILPL